MPSEKTGAAPVVVSVLDWIRTEHFGPLRYGMSMDEVRRLLGPPETWEEDGETPPSPDDASAWYYGDVGLLFRAPFDEHGGLWSVGVELAGIPTGGKRLTLEPWLLRRGLPLREFESALRGEAIPFTKHQGSDAVYVSFGTGGVALFGEPGSTDGDGIGLRDFAIHRPRRPR